MTKLDSYDLRALADALDGLKETTRTTHVVFGGYSTDSLTFKDMVITVCWEPTKGSADDLPEGRYVVEFEG